MENPSGLQNRRLQVRVLSRLLAAQPEMTGSSQVAGVSLALRIAAILLLMEFEWDSGKAADNERKHGVSFSEAATVFGDPLSMTVPDPDHSQDEERSITVGSSASGRLLIIAHADRDGRVRIISARLLTRRERETHESGDFE